MNKVDKEQIVYKGVKKIGNKYFSLYGFWFPEYNLEYQIGKLTKAKPYTVGILVFKDKREAFGLIWGLKDTVLLKCKTENLKQEEIKELAPLDEFKQFYSDTPFKRLILPPPGTYACESLIPIEAVGG